MTSYDAQAQDSFYSQQQQPSFADYPAAHSTGNYSHYPSHDQSHDPRFIPNGGVGSDAALPVASSSGAYLSAPAAAVYGAGGDASTHAHEGYQGLSFVEREPRLPEPDLEQPYEPLYKHTRPQDADLDPTTTAAPPHSQADLNHPQYNAQESQGFDLASGAGMYDGANPPAPASGEPPQPFDSFDQQFSYRYRTIHMHR